MTSQRFTTPRVESVSSPDSASIPECNNANSSSQIDFGRMAEVIASGQIPFPENLSDDVAERLRLQVVRLRRKQFVRLVARAIARDIQKDFL